MGFKDVKLFMEFLLMTCVNIVFDRTLHQLMLMLNKSDVESGPFIIAKLISYTNHCILIVQYVA